MSLLFDPSSKLADLYRDRILEQVLNNIHGTASGPAVLVDFILDN